MKTNELLQEKVKGPAPDWAVKEQADFRRFVADFGFQLTTLKPEKSQLEGFYNFGGDLKDKDNNDLLDKNLRLEALKKGLARYLLDKAKGDRSIKLFTKNYWRHDPWYIHPEDTIRDAERAVENTVSFQTARYDSRKKYLAIHWATSEPK